MNDMPAPRPAPPPTDHERHDPLLIAQLAAGDPLDATQQQLASGLVASCRECAVLAADLRVVSTAVAREPLPPRRRDFRIDPERAEQLRGSALQRFLRRLSLPEARALRPAAAGVLSLGLLFVVAGTVWPDGSPALAPVEPAASPALLRQMEMPVGGTDSSAGVDTVGSDTVSSDTVGSDTVGSDTVGSDTVGSDTAGSDANAAVEVEALEAFGAEAADRAAVDVRATDGAVPPAALDELAMGTAEPVLRAKAMTALPSDGPAAVVAGTAEDAAMAEVPGMAEAPVSSATSAVQAPVAVMAAESPAGSETQAADVSATIADEDRLPIESVLLVVGVILAIAGGLLLLLTWLSRRAADPLLR